MYAGLTYGNKAGNWIGVHQRIDKVARKHLGKLGVEDFPEIADILYFEGNNGPDGIKHKSPSVDEPWHFIDSQKIYNRDLLDTIESHRQNLSKALKKKDTRRASFEAAWLAHSVTDGLTPAHHYPLADKIEELWGKPHHQRSSVKDKSMIRGKHFGDTIRKNWQYWGANGVFSGHVLFEFGVMTAILGKSYNDIGLTARDAKLLEKSGYEVIFERILWRVQSLKTYENFVARGWTSKLSRTTRQQLMPLIIKAVALAWLSAYNESQK